MATVRWADIYDDSDDDDLGAWAAYPVSPRSPSPPPQPRTGLRWADLYDGEDDGGLGPWANYPTRSRSPSPVEQTAKKKRRGKRGKKKPWKHDKYASMFPDLVQEAVGINAKKGCKGNASTHNPMLSYTCTMSEREMRM